MSPYREALANAQEVLTLLIESYESEGRLLPQPAWDEFFEQPSIASVTLLRTLAPAKTFIEQQAK